VVAGEDDVGVVGPDGDVAALPAADVGQVQLGDGAPAGVAGEGDGGVVLLGGVDAVGLAGVGGGGVELGRGLVVELGPALAAVERHAGAAVVAQDHAPGVGRVDPQVVAVAVLDREGGEDLARVGRAPALNVHRPHRLGVGRVGDHAAVVPRSLPQFFLL